MNFNAPARGDLKHGDRYKLTFPVRDYATKQIVDHGVNARWSARIGGYVFYNEDVAQALGCSDDNVRRHKLRPEITDQEDYVLSTQAFPEDGNAGRPATCWTVRGVYKIAMFVHGNKAEAMRSAMAEIMDAVEYGNQYDAQEASDEANVMMDKPSTRAKPMREGQPIVPCKPPVAASEGRKRKSDSPSA